MARLTKMNETAVMYRSQHKHNLVLHSRALNFADFKLTVQNFKLHKIACSEFKVGQF
jgi:hypothetical protein